jgi:putative transposase
MARIARVIAAKYPHHITQRGNRRQDTFFRADDYRYYIETMFEWCRTCDVEIWAYCLMPNHIHLIAVPSTEDGLRRAIGETHRRYTRQINFREKWKGHLWQGRFSSYVMDGQYLLAAARYIELNPVTARLVKRPEQYQWSSARAHMTAKDDELVKVYGIPGTVYLIIERGCVIF